MIDAKSDNAYGPFGSTSRAAGPKRFEGGEPEAREPARPTEEEQELAQTERMDEEEEQRGLYAHPEALDEDEE
jgi:hypothetical protein